MHVICKSNIFPPPAILVLENVKVHVYISNSYNITTDVEALINECSSYSENPKY